MTTTQRAEFEVVSDFKPTGDQPEAIEQLLQGLDEGKKRLTLLGVTGSGKTFTMANVIERWGRPVGVTVAPDGSLLVSDDGGNRIWKISAARGGTR